MPSHDTKIEALLNEKAVAVLLNLSTSSLRRRRAAGLPPAWIKATGSVRYHPDAIRRFIAEGEAKSVPRATTALTERS